MTLVSLFWNPAPLRTIIADNYFSQYSLKDLCDFYEFLMTIHRSRKLSLEDSVRHITKNAFACFKA
jgi:hypothetical protein